MISNITIRPFSQDDHHLFKEGVDLLNRTQGQDLFDPDYLEKLVDTQNARVFAAFDDQRLIGIGVAQIINEYSYYLPFQANIIQELQNKKVGSFSTMAVKETHQGKGIGKLISNARMNWLQEMNCDVVVGVSWVSGLAHTSDRVFENTGFKKVSYVSDFYKQSSIEKPFYCPGCKVQPCACGAVFYKLELKNDPNT